MNLKIKIKNKRRGGGWGGAEMNNSSNLDISMPTDKKVEKEF